MLLKVCIWPNGIWIKVQTDSEPRCAQSVCVCVVGERGGRVGVVGGCACVWMCVSILHVTRDLHVCQRLNTESYTGDLSTFVVHDGRSVCVCV